MRIPSRILMVYNVAKITCTRAKKKTDDAGKLKSNIYQHFPLLCRCIFAGISFDKK